VPSVPRGARRSGTLATINDSSANIATSASPLSSVSPSISAKCKPLSTQGSAAT